MRTWLSDNSATWWMLAFLSAFILCAVLLYEPVTHYEWDYSNGDLIVAIAGDDEGLSMHTIATGLDSEECEARAMTLNKQFRTSKEYGAGGSLAACFNFDKKVVQK